MDVLQLDGIRLVVHPLDGVPDAFGGVVRPGEDVLDLVLLGELVHHGEEGVVLGSVDVGDPGLEEGELQVPHLLPVDHLGVEIQPQAIDQLLDVVHRLLGVPAGVHVEDQGP